jgi:hypothetical protein
MKHRKTFVTKQIVWHSSVSTSDSRQPPHRRQVGISIRKTIRAFVYDVFEDGYPHRSASGGTKTWATDQT